jgi:hypothetical protein
MAHYVAEGDGGLLPRFADIGRMWATLGWMRDTFGLSSRVGHR